MVNDAAMATSVLSTGVGLGFRVWGLGFRVWGLRFRVLSYSQYFLHYSMDTGSSLAKGPLIKLELAVAHIGFA